MSFSNDERTPLITRESYQADEDNVHVQFCRLTGVPPSNLPEGQKWKSSDRALYNRAAHQRTSQNVTYQVTAAISNVLLLTQVVLGAAVTGLGATKNSHVIITVLGATNTIIAGLVAYLKSRGQPMRARMFRDDLERVVDEIENSEIMWLGISKSVNGYDEIDTDGQVTVRSEVARLTRLYDKAVRNNTLNNPDMYGSGDGSAMMSAALKNSKTLPSSTQANVSLPGPPTTGTSADAAGAAAAAPVATDPDESPATAKPTPPAVVKVVTPPVPAKDDKDAKDDEASKDDKGDAKGDSSTVKGDVKPNGTKREDVTSSKGKTKADVTGIDADADADAKDDHDDPATESEEESDVEDDTKAPGAHKKPAV